MTSGSNFVIDDSGNIHAIWLDNGDLNSEDNFAQDVFYSNWDGNDWSNIIQLSSAAADDYIDCCEFLLPVVEPNGAAFELFGQRQRFFVGTV